MSYWRGYSKSPVDHRTNGLARQTSSINTGAFEEEPNDKVLGIQLNNVSKVNHTMKNKFLFCIVFLHFQTYTFPFKSRSPVRAVRDISINIYNGQLTALLGHNGAGKIH